MTGRDTGGRDWFMRAAARVGDLGSPFYAEERQRDVWNEASAVGLQLALWLGLAAATAMVWAGGAAAVPYALTVMGVIGLPACVSVVYAGRLHVAADDPRQLARMRMLPYLALLALFAAGLVRAGSGGLGPGFAVGVGVGTLAVIVVTVLRGRTRPRW